MVAQATTFQSCMLDPTQHINGLCDGDLDTARTFSMIIFYALYGGVWQHTLFQFYNSRWPVDLTAPVEDRVAPVLKTVAFHQFVNYPLIYFPTVRSLVNAIWLAAASTHAPPRPSSSSSSQRWSVAARLAVQWTRCSRRDRRRTRWAWCSGSLQWSRSSSWLNA